jgi:flagellin-like protein
VLTPGRVGRGRRGRRGQANVITVLILVGVTVVMALMLYAYFSNVYVTQSQRQAVLNAIAAYATSLQATVIYTGNSTPATGVYLYCVIVTLHNNGFETLSPYLTVVPLGQSLNGIPGFSQEILYVPMNYNVTPPVQTAFSWILADADQDGIVEMLGGSPGNLTIASQTVLDCDQIYANSTVKADSLVTTLLGGNDVIMEPQTQFTLLDDIRSTVSTVPSTFSLATWRVVLQPGQTVNVYFYVESPVKIQDLALMTFLQFNEYYYYVNNFQLVTG